MRIAAFLIASLFSATAYAETMEVRPKEPVAEFTIPDDWKVSQTSRGIAAVSEDKQVYFWIEAYRPGEFDGVIAEHNKYWKAQDVEITSSDEQKHQEGGKEVTVTNEHATWKGQPTVLYYVEFHLGLASETNIVFTYWASPEGDKTYHKDFGDIFETLNVTEK